MLFGRPALDRLLCCSQLPLYHAPCPTVRHDSSPRLFGGPRPGFRREPGRVSGPFRSQMKDSCELPRRGRRRPSSDRFSRDRCVCLRSSICRSESVADMVNREQTGRAPGRSSRLHRSRSDGGCSFTRERPTARAGEKRSDAKMPKEWRIIYEYSKRGMGGITKSYEYHMPTFHVLSCSPTLRPVFCEKCPSL